MTRVTGECPSVTLCHISGMKIDGPLKELDLDGNLYTENQKPVTPAFEIVFIFT